MLSRCHHYDQTKRCKTIKRHEQIWAVSGHDKVRYLATLTRHTAGVNCVRWSPDGRLLASGGDDGLLLLWRRVSEGEEEEGALAAACGSDLPDPEVWRLACALRWASILL